MTTIVEFCNNIPEDTTKIEILSKTFLNFYLYFQKLHENKKIDSSAISHLEYAFDFSEPILEHFLQEEDYLNAKQNEMQQFLSIIKTIDAKIIKNLKITFEIPKNYSSEQVCDLINHSYIAYASLRYHQNLQNSKVFDKQFAGDKRFYKFPKYIPDTNANISEFLEIVNGIKIISPDKKTYQWFNVFDSTLNIRAIIDVVDDQIVALFINEEEYTEVPSSLIKKLKKQIKKIYKEQKINTNK